jgi:hypothetical protein
MQAPKRRRNIKQISHSRWAAYAAAGAASAITGVSSAEAEIHYSGPIHQRLAAPPGEAVHAMLPLDAGATLTFTQASGLAHMTISGVGGDFVAQYLPYAGVYVSNLGRGVNLSTQSFRNSCTRTSSSSQLVCYGGIIGEDVGKNGYFNEAGVGYIGFDFDRGAGIQYGWARIKITGAPLYRFIVLDYAWGDPHQKIRTGQKSAKGTAEAAADRGSLGLLALGGDGLLAWRQRRRAGL